MPSDIEIAQSTRLQPIEEIAAKLGIESDDLELYGRHKAKVSFEGQASVMDKPPGKMILVTAMTPTPAGEGKTTVSIGLADALNLIGKSTAVGIREPSLGPVFGLKGGAAGGGYSQVAPMEDINLHFTGDIHAVTTVHNLLASLVDNAVFHKWGGLDLTTDRITFRRCLDLCDRSLRYVKTGLGGPTSGEPRETRFDITAASEIMGILALSSDIADLRNRVARIVVGTTSDGKPVVADQVKAAGAMAATLRDALKPNLVQTLGGTPAFIHAGPFGNVSFGCSSLISSRLGLRLGEYFVTEAGFGSDLGAEKFYNIMCRAGGFGPCCTVLVASLRGLRYQGGASIAEAKEPNLQALKAGMPNLEKHIENIRHHGIPPIIAVNLFVTDSREEVDFVLDWCAERSVAAAPAEVWARGGEGGRALAEKVVEVAESGIADFRHLYSPELPLEQKIETIATKMYGADGVTYSEQALQRLAWITDNGYADLPVCVAKTQNSLSDDKSLRGRPSGYSVKVGDLAVAAGAGYVIVYAGNILTMFGLPEHPAAENIDVTREGRITGVF